MIARFAIPFFITVGFIVLPLLLFLLCRKLLPNKRYGTVVGIMLAALEIALVAYGMTGGFQPLEVHHIEYASADLPEAFDGYRIVQFSDVHVGTMTGSRQPMVQELIDSINAQTPDLIVFTGDMQNILPEEMIPPMLYFRQLLAHDGVYAVLGNHDYAVYSARWASTCCSTSTALSIATPTASSWQAWKTGVKPSVCPAKAMCRRRLILHHPSSIIHQTSLSCSSTTLPVGARKSSQSAMPS